MSIIFLSFGGCNVKNSEDNDAFVSDSVNLKVSPDEKNTSTITEKEIRNAEGPDSNQVKKSNIANNQHKEVKVEVKTFINNLQGGYGYDLLMDGVIKIHQPNVPAIPGNGGFKSEEQAKKVGELAARKVRMNIMPPTIEIRELDSLGIKY